MTTRQFCAVLAIGLAFSLAILFRFGPLNGFPAFTHWEWRWHNLGNLRTARALLPPLLLILGVLWRAEKGLSPARLRISLSLLVLANFLLQIFAILLQSPNLEMVREIVISENATGYYSYALRIQDLSQWILQFPQAVLMGHVATHPPGPILFYYLWIKLFGAGIAALLGGCAVGLTGSLGVLMVYWLAGLWTAAQRTLLLAAALYALLPSLTVFFPEFDQFYPVLSMSMVFFWVRALRKFGDTHAACLGAVLFVATCFAYNLLAMGVFLAGYGLYWLWREGFARSAWTLLLRAAGIGLGLCAGLHLVLWISTGYNAPAAFVSALRHQADLDLILARPYKVFAVFDLYDFILGAGVIGPLIVLLRLPGLAAGFGKERQDVALTLIGILTILTVDLSGLLRGEASRVWLFLQPFWVVPAALELSRLRWTWLLPVLLVQWWMVVSIKSKMAFLIP